MNPRAMRYPANTRPAVTMAIRKKPVSLGYPNIPKVLQNYRPHSTGASLLSTGASVPSTGASVPSTGTSVPSTGASIPSTGASVPSTGASLPSTGASVPSSCYGSSKRVLLEATPPTVAANGPSVSMSDGGLKRKRLTDEEEEGLSFKRYQTVPDVNKYIEEQEVQVHRVSSVEEIKVCNPDSCTDIVTNN
ncbi:PREDICTED: uncharacterized protein LOC109593648 [Amphimedon queenslandica]|uniref:Uncharacterized protein n=1 Tax=Amphimedon queenslandica TaxID=400682 RepID=A0AAN0K4F0_AMPQE|nr:PREDICTED: uncharacterized protein LOC109593648 [Amphimedon queenslandica]|eukprot:XP_019864196.1 PREDICTED: uncharacterized protein LOC109593648 [Amphimedon queenslandica]